MSSSPGQNRAFAQSRILPVTLGSPDYLVITWDRERMQQGGRVCCV